MGDFLLLHRMFKQRRVGFMRGRGLWSEKGYELDKWAMKSFPIAFAFFNVAFWSINIQTRNTRWNIA